MTITWKIALVRNLLVSGTNGTLTLIILLIAPLGLTAVVINTALVVLATFITSQTADRVIRFLQSDRLPNDSTTIQVLPDEPGQMQRRNSPQTQGTPE